MNYLKVFIKKITQKNPLYNNCVVIQIKYESYEEYPGITICEDENELPQLNIGITPKGFIAIINFEENGDFNQLELKGELLKSDNKLLFLWEELESIQVKSLVRSDVIKLVIQDFLSNQSASEKVVWIESSVY